MYTDTMYTDTPIASYQTDACRNKCMYTVGCNAYTDVDPIFKKGTNCWLHNVTGPPTVPISVSQRDIYQKTYYLNP